ncbi:FtsX-like permease family protein [Nonomuraea sp. NPDC050310]|uniref:ABC transporter permease n=1 Tax=Nonomuraea sp. NPDC050310 TaxID=3154935 RepID=UPI0033C4358E
MRRLVWRGILRARGRSALIMAMIGLPVLVFTALLTGAATADVSALEGLRQRIGSADAALSATAHEGPVQQLDGHSYTGTGSTERAVWSEERLAALLPAGARHIPLYEGTGPVRLPGGLDIVEITEVDLRDPLAKGLRELRQGRLPATAGEVAATPALAERGASVGSTLVVPPDNRSFRVVGVVADPQRPALQELAALPGALLLNPPRGLDLGWLVDLPGGVGRAEIIQFNSHGLIVATRLLAEEEAPLLRSEEMAVGLGLAIFMIVLETALLAGPAFAIGLRRRRHELALVAAQGGSPRHLRAVVLAEGLILGGLASLLAAGLGVGLGIGGAHLAAGWRLSSIGPVEVPWVSVLGVAVLGVVSALVAALVPAVQAGRQEPARVLAGRAPEVRGKAGKPVLGALLIALGIGLTLLMAAGDGFDRELNVIAAAVLVVLGMIALLPRLIEWTGRPAARLPLPLRLPVRDAVRHRARTASAAAAVMAASSAALAFGIGYHSNFEDNRAAYWPGMPLGTVQIHARDADESAWAKVRSAAAQSLPGRPLIPGYDVMIGGEPYILSLDLQSLTRPGLHRSYGVFGGDVPIGGPELLRLIQGRDDPVAAAALAEGKAVVFDPGFAPGASRVRLAANNPFGGQGSRTREIEVPAVRAEAAAEHQGGAIVPRVALERAGFQVAERKLFTTGSPADELRLERAATAAGAAADVYVEAGYEDYLTPQLWVLFGAAGLLVLGGTLVATRLAAADLRPDQQVMAAIGASGGLRRLVLAGQAGYIALLGAVAGLLVAIVPGVALAWASTGRTRLGHGGLSVSDGSAGFTVAVPWGFSLGLVLGLPLLAALIAGLFTRRLRPGPPPRRLG